jgi:phage repressor protein C with HTH and peptisase S24 domain
MHDLDLHFFNAAVHNNAMSIEIDYRPIVRAIQEKTRETQTELAKRFGVSQPTVSRWLKGEAPELKNVPAIERVAKDLRVLHRKNTPNVTTVPIVGYVGAGGSISFSEGQGPFGDAEMPPKSAPSLVAVTVRGDSMSGMLEDGWTVYYDNRREPPDESHYGKLCIVGLADGRVLVKKLYPGRKPGHFDLHSTVSPALLDQAIDWAARISWIAPK